MELFAFAVTYPILAVCSALLLVPIVLIISDVYTWYYLPPGPMPLPFIGNVLSIPSKDFFVTLEKWSHMYGPIHTIWIGRKPRLVIADPAIAVELLSRRGNRYSSRPRMIMFGEVFGDNTSVASLPYGDKWALQRKFLHHSLKGPSLPAFKPRQEAEALALITSIVNDSDDWSQSLDRFASSVVFSMAYGRRIASLDSNVLKTRQKFFTYASNLMKPGAYLVETFPFLLQLPSFLARWRAPVLQMGREQAAFDIGLVDTVKDDLKKEKGTHMASLTNTMLQLKAEGDTDANALSEAHFAAVPASLFGAGSYTTASTLHFIVLGLLTQPDTQRMAHAELDTIIGKDRSPAFVDQANLPLIEAIIKEGLRWRPTAVFGMPHATSEADVYKGYRIPKGTVVWASSWGINQNPEYFPSAQTFSPIRYLDESDSRYDARVAAKSFPGGSHDHATFGFGRRACAGAELAMNNLFIVIAKLLWSFDIKPIDGEVYDTNAFTGGLVMRPAPFKCKFIIRDESRRLVLKHEMKVAESVLELFPTFD